MSEAPKNICEATIVIRAEHAIPPTCHERFVPLHMPQLRALQSRGIALAGISELRPGYVMSRPDAPFHMVLYTLAGEGQLRTPRGEQPLYPGDIMIAPAHAPYAFEPSGDYWRMLWFHLDDVSYWRGFRREPPQVRRAYCATEITQAMEGILSEAICVDAHQSDVGLRLFAELTALFLNRELRSGVEPHQQRLRKRLYGLWDAVNADLQRRWTVAMLAEHVHVSVTHFHRMSVALTGARPMEMVTRLRMERARDLMLHHSYPLQWIAERVGYDNPFSFSTAFKRYWGLCPREYRSLHASKR